MNSERPEEFSNGASGDQPGSDDSAHHETTTVLVRGETIQSGDPNQNGDSKPRQDAPRQASSPPADQQKRSHKDVSEEKVKLQSRLPALGDDAEVGVQKEHLVARDGKADLSFTGTLLASAAPASAPQGRWQEYRIYETNGGKHVFSKISRNVSADQQDTHEADVFDPTPATVPSKLLRSARDLAHSHPLTWMDAAVGFFGYDPLAKSLYRKLSGRFEERIS
jgi:hypothetical protein